MSYVVGFMFGGAASFFVYVMFTGIGNDNAFQLYGLFKGTPVWLILLMLFIIGGIINFGMEYIMDSIDKRVGVKE